MCACFVGFRDGYGGFQCMCAGFVELVVYSLCVRVFFDFRDGFGGL